MTADDRSIAMHAAGRAFAYHLYGIPIASVSIAVDAGQVGRCTPAPEAVEHLKEACERAGRELDPYLHERIIDGHVVAWYAGPASEAHHTGRSFLECLAEQTESECPIDIIFRLMPDPDKQAAYRRRMQEQALVLVADSAARPTIDALADALQHAREIDGATTSRIIADAMPDDVPAVADWGDDAVEWVLQEFDRLK